MNIGKLFKGGNTPLNGVEPRKMTALRVFLIVAALHAVVLGPILIFEGCKNASSEQKMSDATETPPTGVDAIALPVQPVTNSGAIATAQPAPTTNTAIAPVALPVSAPTATLPTPMTPVAAPTGKTYKVVEGDSLWKIAKAERVSVGDLMRANNLNDKSVLRIGQTLQIPAATVAERIATTNATLPLPTGATAYVVQSGDSLWTIARKNNLTVNALKEANKLTSTTLRVGQKLVIPAASAAPAPSAGNDLQSVDPLTGGRLVEGDKTYHVVGQNEVLEIIARKYNVDRKEIIAANHLPNGNSLRVGQKLFIPVKAQAPATPAPTAPLPTPAG